MGYTVVYGLYITGMYGLYSRVWVIYNMQVGMGNTVGYGLYAVGYRLYTGGYELYKDGMGFIQGYGLHEGIVYITGGYQGVYTGGYGLYTGGYEYTMAMAVGRWFPPGTPVSSPR